MKDFWDTRYSDDIFAYGVQPNLFFAAELSKLSPGKLLLPAEGEGRNAVFAAQQGWQAHAFDLSEKGKTKALQLAKQRNVCIHYQVVSAETAEYPEFFFDAAALIYAHFPLSLRKKIHRKTASFIRPGGILIFEGFSKSHQENQKSNPLAGGPKNPDMLFSLMEIQQDFEDFDLQLCDEREILLNEGLYHKGKANVIRLIGIRK